MEKKGIKEDTVEMSDAELMALFAFKQRNGLSGWFPAPYDPNQLMGAFPSLWLREGHALMAYQSLDNSGNGGAYVFAYPKRYHLPRKAPKKALERLFWNDMVLGDNDDDDALSGREGISRILARLLGLFLPAYRSLPVWMNRGVEAVLEGDGSPLSYFQTSLYLRTIGEVGALWHNIYWGHHRLLTTREALPEEEWTWYEPEPADWRPQVWKDEKGGGMSLSIPSMLSMPSYASTSTPSAAAMSSRPSRRRSPIIRGRVWCEDVTMRTNIRRAS